MDPKLIDFLLATCSVVVGMAFCMVLSIKAAVWLQRRRIAVKFTKIRKWVNHA